jgi:cytoskeletal protein CcmA (bactofilin family)
MTGSKSRPGRRVGSFFLFTAACVASGTAAAQCFSDGSTLPPFPTPGEVPCYIVVQPIDVCGTSGPTTCAPFNTTSETGDPSTAGYNVQGQFMNETSPNPIGFVVDPTTGVSPPPSGDINGVDITRTLLNQLGVDLMWLPMATYNSQINPNTGTFQTLNVFQTTNSSGATILQSDDFLTLSFQKQISDGKPTFGPPSGTPNPNFPKQPLGWPPNVINMFFVATLNPPTEGGMLYGFGWICNNGAAISQNTFGFPRSRTSPPPRPDTIAHELGHNLCLDHPIFGAGPYNPWDPNTNLQGGVVPAIPDNPLLSECDPSYPACARNLMTTGSLRTEPAVECMLAALPTPTPCFLGGVEMPTLANGKADQVTTPSSASPTQLPLSQQAEVLTGGSGLLQTSNPSMKSGFLNPIPRERTKAQIGTGDSSTGQIIFDLSGPTGGRPGETLVAWILTLPQEQTFARYNRFHIVSQSRQHLIQDVDHHPDTDNNPVVKDIAYFPDADNNRDTSSSKHNREKTADTPCTAPTAECLIIKFESPGLGPHDSISFSSSVLSGDAPITNNDLCKAKITYIFSDGYATTSNLGPCPAVSLPLIASSWRPDPTVSPRFVKPRALLTVADAPLHPPLHPLPCTTDSNGHCLDPTQTGLSDADPSKEGGQPGHSCNNGELNGTIHDNVTVSAGQNCVFTSPCEIRGNLTINGGNVYLDCDLDGNLTENGGTLKLDASAHVFGNVQISQASAFTLAHGAVIDGNLRIEDLSETVPQKGTVCGTQVKGNLVAQNNISPIEIGGTTAQHCAGNTVAGNLQCTNNTALTGAANIVKGHALGQCATFVQ